MPIEDEISVAREEISKLLAAGRRVVPKFTPEKPIDWNPGQVTDPRSGMQFTHQTCWFFIEEQLNSGCDLEVVELKHPPGKKGYVMIVDPGPDVSDIYIKLQIGSGTVIGRSFHYSTLPKRSNRNFGRS